MNVTMIPGYWKKLNSGDYVLIAGTSNHELARIFKGCGKDRYVLCIGDYKFKSVCTDILKAQQIVISEIFKRVRAA